MEINLPKTVAIGFLMLLAILSNAQQKGTVTDIEGNTYQTVVIGNQEWMAENLRVAKFNNGDAITNAQSSTDWENGFDTPLWSNFNNDNSYDAIYGKLYNHKVVSDNRNVCPDGWHVPSQAEWETLITGLGGTSVAGGKLKATGTDYWNADNVGATNESGFNALGAGYRDGGGNFLNFNNYGDFWTSTLYSSFNGYYVSLNYNSAGTYIDYTSIAKGSSIRCLKTQEPTVELPTLTTTTVTNITQTTASSGGAITDDGGADITAKGVVWSTSTSPTLDANDGFTSNGTGTTEFNSDITGLDAATTYYVRAYATNSAGTGYGNEVQFTTSSTAPFTEPAWVHMNYQNSPIPSGYGLQAQEDSQGNVWLAVGASIVKYTTEGQIIKYENPDATTEFSSFVLEDDNTMWVCNRSNGVFKFDGNGNWTQYNTENTSMTSNYIYSMAVDSQGNKWIASNGGGLVKYDDTNWTIWTAENSDLPANTIHSIFIDNDDNVWLGFSGYLAKFDGTTLDVWNGEQTGYGVGGTISAISIDANDNIWIGKDWNLGVAKSTLNDLSTWTQYSYSNSDYPESRAVAIDFDAEGRVWFGTDSKGLVVFDGAQWSVFNSETSTSWPSSSCDWVTSFFTDTKSVMWVGTHDGFILTNSIVPTVTTYNVSEVTETSAKTGGTVDFYGGADITAKGVVWSTSTSPTLDANNGFTTDGTGITEFNSDITGLDAATTYYVRAYATNSAGTGYGNEVQFTTQESSTEAKPLPFNEDFESGMGDWTVIDQDDDGKAWAIYDDADYARSGTKSSRITYNSNGNNDWLITPLLDLPADESIKFTLWARSYGSSFLESFDIKIISNDGQQVDDIASETEVPETYTEYTYNLSSYAGQEVKVAIVCVSVDQFYLYVDDVSCVVDESAVKVPTVTTMNVTNITQTTASSGGAITDDGGADITAKGVVWGTSANPTLESNSGNTTNGTGTAEFTSELTGLTASTTYYVRAYATNSAGTAYGEQKSFSTTPTSVDIESLANISIYPNPFTSTLTLESEKGISQVVVMNVSGQVVLAKQANGQSKLVLEANNLDTGLYIVKLTEVDGTILHTRIVKR